MWGGRGGGRGQKKDKKGDSEKSEDDRRLRGEGRRPLSASTQL